MIHVYNTLLGKEITSLYAHEDSVVKLFYSPNSVKINNVRIY